MTILSGVIWAIQDGHYGNNDKTCSMTPFNISFKSFKSWYYFLFPDFRTIDADDPDGAGGNISVQGQ